MFQKSCVFFFLLQGNMRSNTDCIYKHSLKKCFLITYILLCIDKMCIHINKLLHFNILEHYYGYPHIIHVINDKTQAKCTF